MFKFFRKIRRKLLSKSDYETYIRYALGEIFLVVVGILIALSINNWNEDRKERKLSRVYHERLVEDLEMLLKHEQNISDIAIRTLKSISKTIELLEQGKALSVEDKDTVDNAMIWFSRTNYQMPEIPTYEEMKSNGDLNLIYDVELRKRIVNFNNFLEQIDDVVSKLSTAIESDFYVFNRYLRSYADPETLEIRYSYDFQKMASDTEFINTFSRLAYHWRGYVYFYERLEAQAEKLDNELKDYLNQERD